MMIEDVNHLLTRANDVRRVLQDDMPQQDIWQTCRVTGPVISTEKSRIFQAFTDTGEHPYAIKCVSPEEASEQFNALGKVATLLATREHFRSPSPVALLKPSGIVVMDWVDAPSFQTLCLTPRTPRTLIEKAITQCGEMLSCLHEDIQQRANVLDTADFLNDIDLAFDGKTPPKALTPAMHLLKATAQSVHDLDLPVAVLHGDFKSANLLLKDTTVWTIDAAMKWQGATVHDAAHFLNQFALDLYHPGGLRLRHRLKSMEDSFIKAYEREGYQLSLLALQWLRLQRLVILYADQYRRKSSPIASLYLLLCLRVEINRIIRNFPT